MLKLTTIFKIRVVYKSGYTHDFEVYSFKLKGGTYTWESADDKNKPIELGGSEIAAVYQIGYRKVLRLNRAD